MDRTVFVNPELVRNILLTIERASYPLKGRIGTLVIDHQDQQVVNDHIDELRRAGLLNADVTRSRVKPGGPIIEADVRHLTDAGWILVNLVKRTDNWNRVQSAVSGNAVSMPELLNHIRRGS